MSTIGRRRQAATVVRAKSARVSLAPVQSGSTVPAKNGKPLASGDAFKAEFSETRRRRAQAVSEASKAMRPSPGRRVYSDEQTGYIKFPKALDVLILAPRDAVLDLRPIVVALEELRRCHPIRVLVNAKCAGVGLPLAQIAYEMGIQYLLCDLPAFRPQSWTDLDQAMFARLVRRAWSWNLMDAIGWGMTLADIVVIPYCGDDLWTARMSVLAKERDVARRFVSADRIDPTRTQIDPNSWSSEGGIGGFGASIEFDGGPLKVAKRSIAEAKRLQNVRSTKYATESRSARERQAAERRSQRAKLAQKN